MTVAYSDMDGLLHMALMDLQNAVLMGGTRRILTPR